MPDGRMSLRLVADGDSASQQLKQLVDEALPLFESVPEVARELVLQCLLREFKGLARCELMPAGAAGDNVLRFQFVLPGAAELFAAALRAAEADRPDMFHGGGPLVDSHSGTPTTGGNP